MPRRLPLRTTLCNPDDFDITLAVIESQSPTATRSFRSPPHWLPCGYPECRLWIVPGVS